MKIIFITELIQLFIVEKCVGHCLAYKSIISINDLFHYFILKFLIKKNGIAFIFSLYNNNEQELTFRVYRIEQNIAYTVNIINYKYAYNKIKTQ